jgi:Spy/CpxP family protein refolding chaperone
MKKLLLLSIFTAIIASPVWSQETKEKDKQKEYAEWQQKVKEELKLTDEQVTKWEALNKDAKEKMDALSQDATMSKEVQKEKKMAIKKEKEEKFLQLLTPEQQAKYKEMVEKKKKESETKQGGS